MDKIKCIAIDDEYMALDIIKDYIEKVPFLDLLGVFKNSMKAFEFIKTNNINLIFLDINMPDLSGIQFLESLDKKPMVIFTTAYSTYAVDSYNFNAIDYLLKPIEFERFLKAANKALDDTILKNRTLLIEKIPEKDAKKSFVLIKSGTEIHKLRISDILFIEGTGNYLSFHLPDKKILSLLNMKQVLDLLPKDSFYRIHKSYIVSFQHIDSIEKHQVKIMNKAIPIGSTYREEFFKSIENK
ncbi:LytR/AlgR family response regulator transcription factor [Bacteroidota bacterium]